MNDFESLLKVLVKFGYPNEDFVGLCNLSGFNPDNFLPDMVEHLGIDKSLEFVGNAFEKLEEKGKGIYIPLWEEREYVYLIIESYAINPEESEDCVFIDWTWGDNKVLDDMGRMSTLKDIDEDNDPWDLDDFYDSIKQTASDQIYKMTGFNICWGI